MDLISSWGKIILFSLFLVGLAGLVLHGALSSRLAFVDFGRGDTSDKKNVKRIIVPFIIVVVVCAVIPIIAVYSHQELYDAVNEEGIYVKFPWKYIMPAVAMEVSIITCAVIGGLFYFLLGLLSYKIVGGVIYRSSK